MFTFFVIMQCITIAIMFVEVLYISSYSNSKQNMFLLMLTVAAIINNTGYLLEMLAASQTAAVEGTKLCYLGKVYIPLVLFLFTFHHCHIHIPLGIKGVLVLIHTGVWVLVLTSGYQSLYYSSIQYVHEGVFAHLELGHGIVYNLYMGLMAVEFFASFTVLARFYVRARRPDIKKCTLCFMISICAAVVGLMLFLTGLTGGYDTTAVAYCVGAVLLLFSITRYNLLDTVEMAKAYAVDHLAEGLFVFDNYGEIIFLNEMAGEIFPGLNDREKADFVREDLQKKSEKPEPVFVRDKIYQVNHQRLGHGGKFKGELYLLNDVTEQHNYEERLEEAVRQQTRKAEERRQKVEQMSLQTVQTLASVIDAKDRYTKGHSTRVAEYSVKLAREFGCGEEEINNLQYAALLHDIGKIGVPDSILNKPGKLSDTEYEVIKSHAAIGGDILKNIAALPGVEDVARYHHERYDGRGYPEGKKAEDIPLNARIAGIADAYDAMNSRRVYRKALTKEKIREELVRGRGTQFDPELLDIFLRLLDEDRLDIEEAENPVENISEDTDRIVQKIMETRAQEGAETHDFLTGIMLRQVGEQAITEAMKKSNGCLALVDVDNLKIINDTFGHLTGDYLLHEVGDILADQESRGIACRFGGDQFLFFMQDVSESEAGELAEEIIRRFDEKKQKDAMFGQASLSVGLCMCMREDEYSDVFARADKALYHVKQNGKGRHYLYAEGKEWLPDRADVDLDRLVESLQNSGRYTGALDVEYQTFAKLYEYTKNYGERYNQDFVLAMITLNEKSKTNIDEIEKAMQCMEQAIQSTIRNVDICTRYSSVQFLIILLNVGDGMTEVIINRILQNFYKLYHGHSIEFSYAMSSL